MADDYEKRLRSTIENIAKEHGYGNHEISMREFHTGGANYTSRLFHITLKASERDDLNLFAKVAAIGEQMRLKYPLNLYDTEIFIYNELLKRYKELENRDGIDKKYALSTTKFYGFSKEHLYETLVLDDLKAKGFKMYDRFKSIDWPYATQSVFELAKFHALSIALRENDPEEFHNLTCKFGAILETDQFKSVFDSVFAKAITAVKEENRQRVIDFIDKQDFNLFAKPIRYPVLTHGDYRPSNLMHKEYEDGSLDIVPLDYQGCQACSPLTDLMYFIFSGSDADFRSRYYRKLLDHYYSELSSALVRLHVDPEKVYSKEDFEYELELMQPYGLIMGFFLLPVITVYEENAPKMTESNLEDFEVKPNALGVQRLNELVNDFIKMGIL